MKAGKTGAYVYVKLFVYIVLHELPLIYYFVGLKAIKCSSIECIELIIDDWD